MLYTIVYSCLHAIAEYRLYSMVYSMVCMLYSTIPTPASLAVYLAGSPLEARPDTPASSVHPLLVHLHNLPREGTWIGRTTTTSRTLLLVEVSKATWRIPWRRYS